jgi:hypothetical protein
VPPGPVVGEDGVGAAAGPVCGYISAGGDGGVEGGCVGDVVVVAGHVCGERVFDWVPVVWPLNTGSC